MTHPSDHEQLIALSGADPESLFWHSAHPDSSIPLFQEIQGDEPYRTSLRKAAYDLYGLLQQNSIAAAERPLLPRKPTGKFMDAMMLLLHSLSYIASHPRIVQDGKTVDQKFVAIPLDSNEFAPGKKHEGLAYGPFRKTVSALRHFAPEGGQPWIEYVRGFYDQQTRQGKRTRIAPSRNFCDWMQQQGLIFPKRNADKGKSKLAPEMGVLQVSFPDPLNPDKKIKFPLNRPLQGDEAVLPVLNARLAKHEIACPLPDYKTYEAYYDFIHGYSRLFLSGQEYFQRIFSNEDGCGGRIYGRWAPYVPSKLRRYLKIGGMPTTELDYQNMQLALYYAMAGKTMPDGDLYKIEGQDRGWMKEVLASSLGVATMDEALQALRGKLAKANLVREGLAEAMYDAFWDYHSAVYPHGEGAEALWGKLQYADGQIALRVLRYLLDDGIVAIPIHDSFLVQKQHREKLKATMMAAWQDFWPSTPITIKINH